MGTCVLRRSKCVFMFRSNIFQVLGAVLKKTLLPLLMDMVQLSQGYSVIRRGSLPFTTKFLEISGTHLIDLGRMKGFKRLRVTFC